MRIKAKNPNDAMFKMLKALKHAPIVEVRGLKTKEIINVNLVIKNVSFKNAIITKHLPADPNYISAEIATYEKGTNKLSDFSRLSKFWNKISDDGETIRSAYGYIIAEKHGFNQFEYCINELMKDNDTRKAVITFKTPYEKPTKDNICTLSMQFILRDQKLHAIVNMRSNDINYGFRNDLPYFVYLMTKMRTALNLRGIECDLGMYYHNVGSLHIYENTMKELKWKI